MLKIIYLVLVLSIVTSAQNALGAVCLDSAIPRGESSSSVKLLTQVSKPYFYFRAFDDHFAILVSANSVHRALESASTDGNSDARELLDLIVKDLPLTRSTDLFTYVLSDPYQLTAIQYVLVRLLESGDAAVFDAETGRLSASIEMRVENSERIRSRTFYSSSNRVLLRSVDCIQD